MRRRRRRYRRYPTTALIEELFDKAVQDLRVEDAVSQALQQAQEADAQMTRQAEEAAGAIAGD
jgi:hypothetical protein